MTIKQALKQKNKLIKKILTLLLLLPIFSFGQKNKYIKPMILFDLVVQKQMFDGLSSNVGILMGDEKFTQIGLLVGYRQHSPANNMMKPMNTLMTASILWKAQVERFLFLPMFSYGNESYQDLSFRIGYAVDKNKSTYIHMFTSSQMGFGIGTMVELN